MPYAKNGLDGVQTYFEDLGGDGPPVVLYAGLTQSIEQLKTWGLKRALEGRARLILADHRGHGQSDKPREQSMYAGHLRAADFVALLDALALAKAHVLGYSWGARLGFWIGETQTNRVLSLMLGGHQPYAFRRDGPIVRSITEGLDLARREGMTRLVQSIEARSGSPMAPAVREGMLKNDALALHAAWTAALEEGSVSKDLTAWRLPCLIFAGDGDTDFYEDARRAANEIPGAKFVSLTGRNHMTGHAEVEAVLPWIVEMLEKLGLPEIGHRSQRSHCMEYKVLGRPA